MSFVLPGNARELRFSGEVKALAPDAAPRSERVEPAPTSAELGKPRVRRPPATKRIDTPAAKRIDTPTRVHEEAPRSQPAPRYEMLRQAPPAPPPSEPAPRAAARAPRLNPALYGRAPLVREKPLVDPDPSFDDNCLTMAMVRDGLDVLPGARALAPKEPRVRAPSPAPFFRSHPPPQAPSHWRDVKTVRVSPKKTSRGLPLAVWLVAAAIAGLVSFRFTPDLVARLDLHVATR